MANTILLRRRIKTAQNVSKATRAMHMISTSKLKKAQDAVLASRPYVEKLTDVVNNMTANMEKGETHPYMQQRQVTGKNLIIVIAPDKGLCGGLVANLTREYLKQSKEKQTAVVTVGKKIESAVVRSKKEVIASFIFGTTVPAFSIVAPIVKVIDEYYLEGKVDSVYIVFTKFTSVFTQQPVTQKILPLELSANTEKKALNPVQLFEPSVEQILPSLLQHYLEMVLYQYLLESYASEQASRMIAMQNATDNAKEIIEDLKLIYNKTRQEKITSELLDISGSQAAFQYE